MPVEHPEHQVIQDVRLHRGHDDTVATEDVAKLEALHMSLLTPAQREMALRDFDNKARDYDESFGTNLRKQGQVHRFRTYLKTAHEQSESSGALNDGARLKRDSSGSNAMNRLPHSIITKGPCLKNLGRCRALILRNTKHLLTYLSTGVRKMAFGIASARPWVVATFLTEHAHRGEEFALNVVNAIGALHDYHGQPNPAATQQCPRCTRSNYQARGAAVLDQSREGNVFVAPVRHSGRYQSARTTARMVCRPNAKRTRSITEEI